MKVFLDLEDSAVHAHQLNQLHLLVSEPVKLLVEDPIKSMHEFLDLIVIQGVLREVVLALKCTAASEQLTRQGGQINEYRREDDDGPEKQ